MSDQRRGTGDDKPHAQQDKCRHRQPGMLGYEGANAAMAAEIDPSPGGDIRASATRRQLIGVDDELLGGLITFCLALVHIERGAGCSRPRACVV